MKATAKNKAKIEQKKVITFLQTLNPRTKRWVKLDAGTGKIISTKKTPGKYKGVKVAKLAKKSAKITKTVKALSGVVKKAAKTPKARKGWAQAFRKADAEFKDRVNSEKQRIKHLTATHLGHVKSETGKVTKEDRDYCKALGERMLDHKFGG